MSYPKNRKPRGYWGDYDNCYNEARKYSSRSELREKNPVAYKYARINKWLDEYFWFSSEFEMRSKAQKKWTIEDARKIISENGFKSLRERRFVKMYSGLVKAIEREGWEEQLSIEKRLKRQREKLTFDKCYEVAITVSSKKDLRKISDSIDNACRRNDWFKYFYWFEDTPNIYGTINQVYGYFFTKFNAVYIGRTYLPEKRKWQHNTDEKDTVFKFAKEHGVEIPEPVILESELTLEKSRELEGVYVEKYRSEGMVILNKSKTGGIGAAANSKYTYKHCYDCAKKCETYGEFNKNYKPEFRKSKTMGWLSKFDWLIDDRKVYQYSMNGVFIREFNSVGAAAKEVGVSHTCISNAANGVTKCSGGFRWSKKPNEVFEIEETFDTIEKCREEAKKFSSLEDFHKGSHRAYKSCVKHGWLYDVMPRKISERNKWQIKENCYNEAIKYTNKEQFRKGCSGAHASAWKHGWLDEFFPKAK